MSYEVRHTEKYDTVTYKKDYRESAVRGSAPWQYKASGQSDYIILLTAVSMYNDVHRVYDCAISAFTLPASGIT